MNNNNDDNKKFAEMATKISPAAAEVWNEICEARKTNTYHMLQNFIYTMIRAAADFHALNPDIQKILTMLETDAGWQKAFNLCAPNADTRVAQVVLILEQKDRKGFGAVMIDKPFMGDAQMTECTDEILERVTEVTMPGIYRRVRLLGGQMDCNNLSDVLLTLIERQSNDEIDKQNQQEMQGPGNYTDYGKEYAYGKRTKAKHHKSVDMYDRQQRISFSEAEQIERALGGKPFGVET